MSADAVSVVVPAHEAEATVGGTLTTLLADAQPGELEVIVVCNGCTDRTADVARSFGPGVKVLEVGHASKPDALNMGDQVATYFPRLYLDADVQLTAHGVRELTSVLGHDGCLAAAPRLSVDADGVPRIIRSYLRIWSRLPDVVDGLSGRGAIALTKEGRCRFDDWPAVVADDQFVQRLFASRERIVVESCESVVSAPPTVGALVRRKTRVFAGNRVLRDHAVATGFASEQPPTTRWLTVVAREPALLLDVPAFVGISVLAKARAARVVRSGAISWEGRA